MIEGWVRHYEGDPEFEFDRLAIDVCERIVERMEALGITRTELAEAVGVSKARISQILSGHDNLTLKSLVAIAIGLGSRIEFRLVEGPPSRSAVTDRHRESAGLPSPPVSDRLPVPSGASVGRPPGVR